ncbi:hypothetical protein J2Y45_006563 [Dyadobacter sp. BE34]|uniref:Uncharacterized protein n=1 Tax=Dyadobacter fermentans TaxID=94254 RepID=A0ABU1R857_9BACT|nr:hypothetical protein [Dyadobacter fermentans]MDR7047163.1 hypothetical protein [Dyadobacter sp. BE242]MDR7201399.1 hypothetical protein [Dyadobacter sp. BE34]MDR7219269.1 hypothetical protein [Dyadobacter sp. BE31]MDR7267035.1 hypothetical protein [Dyadobacter sp. BE32]
MDFYKVRSKISFIYIVPNLNIMKYLFANSIED